MLYVSFRPYDNVRPSTCSPNPFQVRSLYSAFLNSAWRIHTLTCLYVERSRGKPKNQGQGLFALASAQSEICINIGMWPTRQPVDARRPGVQSGWGAGGPWASRLMSHFRSLTMAATSRPHVQVVSHAAPCGIAVAARPKHVIFLANGLYGVPSNWHTIVEELESRMSSSEVRL